MFKHGLRTWWGIGGAFCLFFSNLLLYSSLAEPTEKVSSKKYSGKKVFLIDSYHKGYEWSDGILKGALSVFDKTGVELQIFHMDTKRNTSEKYVKKVALDVKNLIDKFKPDVLLACDDNASKYVIKPYFRDVEMPVVFCGVNWDARVYGFPYKNTTGIIEVDDVEDLMELLSRHSKGARIGYLGVDTETTRKHSQICQKRFFDGQLKIYLVKGIEAYRRAFLKAQKEVDLLYIFNNAGIDWDSDKMKAFFEENTKIPTGSNNPWLAPYVLMTLGKVPEEFGEWSARTTLRILDGEKPESIPMAKNAQTDFVINMNLAKKMKLIFPLSILKTARMIGDTSPKKP